MREVLVLGGVGHGQRVSLREGELCREIPEWCPCSPRKTLEFRHGDLQVLGSGNRVDPPRERTQRYLLRVVPIDGAEGRYLVPSEVPLSHVTEYVADALQSLHG